MPQSWSECRRKACMKLILDEDYDCPSANMRLRLGWMTLHNRRRMLRTVCTRRCLRGMRPNYMERMFATNESLGLWSARRPRDLHLNPCKTNWLSRSFAYCTGQDWNGLPLSIRDASDITLIYYSCNHTSRESNGPMLRVKLQTFRPNPGPSSVSNDLEYKAG